jgi:hypothetical protein
MIYGRGFRQLFTAWAVSIAAFILLRLFDVYAPAFHELLIPFYWIIFGITLVLTWRWFRSRSSHDRRGRDRRQASRRGDPDSSQAAAPERDEK